MNLNLSIGPLVSLIAGILILVVPRLLNYIVAIYLIVIGLLGLFGGVSRPRHHNLRRARKRQQRFPTANAYRLKVADLLRARERILSLRHKTKGPGQRLDVQLG